MSAVGEEQKGRIPTLEELRLTAIQLENDLKLLGDSFAQLQMVQGRFVQNIATLASLKGAENGHELMIPLNPSVFVSGCIKDKERVLVDIGTGYFLEKTIKDADDYYTRKIKFLQEQLNMLEKVIGEKRESFLLIVNALKSRVNSGEAIKVQE